MSTTTTTAEAIKAAEAARTKVAEAKASGTF